jgi:cobalt-zinc-cadmium efflux system membrane fusion protein
MKAFLSGRLLWIGLITMVLLSGCARQDSHDSHDEGEAGHGHGNDAGDDHGHGVEAARGPMGGRLFTADGLQLELRIEEEEGPPMFLAYLYDGNGNPLSPEGATLQVTLHRFADRTDVISFAAVANHLRGDGIVGEPHSFEAVIQLNYNTKDYQFGFEQHEFRVELSQAAVYRAKIVTEPAGPGHIDVTVSSPGEVRLNGERMVMVRPRFAGVVTEMRKRLGDTVSEGDVLAVIQSNSSLTEYTITAPMSGNIVARAGMVGGAVDNESLLYTLADLSSVWVDFAIYPQHVGLVKRGQPVTVQAATRPGLLADDEVSYVGPLLEAETRVSQGRIELPNSDGLWQPGLYVNVTAIVDHADVAVSVPEKAIIRSKFGPAVFLAVGPTFEVQPVTPGRSDGKRTEIVEGLEAGAMVVVENAYLLKAEMGRGAATHDH